MPYNQNPTSVQIELIEDAMKKAGVWSNEIPEWVNNYHAGYANDIWQWLQFIYLPMRKTGSSPNSPYLATQLISHLNSNPTYIPILQKIIELDAITPTTS